MNWIAALIILACTAACVASNAVTYQQYAEINAKLDTLNHLQDNLQFTYANLPKRLK